jgi:hypothetical protein
MMLKPDVACLGLLLELALDHTTALDGDALEAHLAIHYRTAANGQISAIQ